LAPTPFRVTVPFTRSRTDKKKGKTKGTEEFFGSTHVASILGFRSKKKDIDYGKDLSAQAKKDIKSTDPILRNQFNKAEIRNMLSKPKRYFTPTKKQSRNFLKL
jgi:hypothetical protein